MLRFLFDRKLQPQGANILKTSIEVQWRLLFNIQYIQNNSQKIQRILSNPFWTHSNNKKKGLIIVGGFQNIVFRARGCKHEAKEGSGNWRDRSLDSRLWLYSKRFSKEKWPNSFVVIVTFGSFRARVQEISIFRTMCWWKFKSRIKSPLLKRCYISAMSWETPSENNSHKLTTNTVQVMRWNTRTEQSRELLDFTTRIFVENTKFWYSQCVSAKPQWQLKQ